MSDPLQPLYVFDGATTDNYQYLRCPGAQIVQLQITNASVLISYGVLLEGSGSAQYPPGNDEPFLPIVGSFDQPCDEIRFKSYVPGTPAIIKIRAKQ